jgi:hypothetical protein
VYGMVVGCEYCWCGGHDVDGGFKCVIGCLGRMCCGAERCGRLLRDCEMLEDVVLVIGESCV